MAVDQSLISGSYRANAPVVTGSGLAAGLSEFGKSISTKAEEFHKDEMDLVDKEIQDLNKTNEQYDSYVNQIVEGSELEGEELGSLYDNLQEGKQRYLDADDKGKAMIRQELNKMYEDYDAFENLKEAHAGLTGEMSVAFTNSPDGLKITEAFSNPSKFMKMKDGRIGMEIGGKFKTVSEISKIVEGGRKDTAFTNVFDAVDSAVSISKEDYPKDGFDALTVRKTYSKYIDRSKNLKSLMNDVHVGDTSFKEDLLNATSGKTYSQLGITPEMLKQFDTNSDNELSEEERVNLVNSLEDNPKILKDMLADYFTDLTAQLNGFDLNFPRGISDNTKDTFGVAVGDANRTDTTIGPKNQMKVFAP